MFVDEVLGEVPLAPAQFLGQEVEQWVSSEEGNFHFRKQVIRHLELLHELWRK